jgi:hypothetical protein
MIVGPSKLFRDEQPDPVHPFSVGERVTIFQLFLPKRPLIEGRAEIIAPITRAAHLYLVRFEGEQREHARFVHPGDWQSAQERQHAALLAHWRTTLTPDILTHFERRKR